MERWKWGHRLGRAHQRRFERAETDALDAVDAVHRVEQVAQALARVRAEGRGLNAGQHHLAHTCVGECARLGDDIGNFLGADVPARIRNLAVGAAVITAVLNLDVGAGARRMQDAHGLKVRACKRGDLYLRDRLAVEQLQCAFHRAQLILRAADVGNAVDGGDRFGRYLRIAAADHDLRFGRLPHQAADQLAALAVALGGHGAGVDHGDVGALRHRCKTAAHRLFEDGFALVLADLAAQGIDRECPVHETASFSMQHQTTLSYHTFFAA